MMSMRIWGYSKFNSSLILFLSFEYVHTSVIRFRFRIPTTLSTMNSPGSNRTCSSHTAATATIAADFLPLLCALEVAAAPVGAEIASLSFWEGLGDMTDPAVPVSALLKPNAAAMSGCMRGCTPPPARLMIEDTDDITCTAASAGPVSGAACCSRDGPATSGESSFGTGSKSVASLFLLWSPTPLSGTATSFSGRSPGTAATAVITCAGWTAGLCCDPVPIPSPPGLSAASCWQASLTRGSAALAVGVLCTAAALSGTGNSRGPDEVTEGALDMG